MGLFVVCAFVDCLLNLVGLKYSWTLIIIVTAVNLALYALFYKYMKDHVAVIKKLKANG
jgi:hypothetical protein